MDYDKIVDLYYTNRQGESNALSVISLNYQSSIGTDNQWEFWGANSSIYVDGISEILNITYQATDIGETYYDVLNIKVKASGAPEPSLPQVPKPYASPKGFSDDISTFLAVHGGSELVTAFNRMFLNINPAIPGAAKGVVVAAQSGPSYPQTDPDYEFDWVRDSSLTMDVVQTLFESASNDASRDQYKTALFQYAKGRAVEQNDPGLQTGLGEPKFYLNNTIFTGPWGRPQNDGPATAAITLMNFANTLLDNDEATMSVVQRRIWNSNKYPQTAPVKKDLLFVASNWSYPSFDLWEEESSDHFYTRMVQRRALVMGTDFAKKVGDSATASTLSVAADALTATLSEFWDPNRKILVYEYGPILRDKSSYLDTAVILGVIHGYANDGVYGYTNDQVQSTALRIATSFIPIYPIAKRHKDSTGLTLGIPVGRYPEDVYNGTGTQTNGGNPWYLCTAAFAQYMYASSFEYATAGKIQVTTTSKPFWNYFAPQAKLQAGHTYSSTTSQYQNAIDALNGWGDAFMRTVKYYTPDDRHLAEEFNRNTGVPQGAADLTWSYASVLTAAFQRAATRGQKAYVQNLANKGFTPNQ